VRRWPPRGSPLPPLAAEGHRPNELAIMPGRFWSGSYCAASCGGAPLQVVKDYIENQKQPN